MSFNLLYQKYSAIPCCLNYVVHLLNFPLLTCAAWCQTIWIPKTTLPFQGWGGDHRIWGRHDCFALSMCVTCVSFTSLYLVFCSSHMVGSPWSAGTELWPQTIHPQPWGFSFPDKVSLCALSLSSNFTCRYFLALHFLIRLPALVSYQKPS